jgi:uncharacterized membrane protein SpoIIM required for sporulation
LSIDRFIETRQTVWDRLEELVRRADKGRVARLSDAELAELDRLYHQAAGDLARAQAGFPDAVPYLNRLVARAHQVIYQPPPGGLLAVKDFYAIEAPRVILRTMRYSAFSAAIFLLGFAFAFLVGHAQPDATRSLIPDSFADVAARVEAGRAGPEVFRDQAPWLTSYVLTNNLRVAMLAATGGIAFGAVTVYILFMNGLQLGAFASVFHVHGLAFTLWSTLLAHGFLELTAVALAGGAGLIVASALVAPGLLSRRDALQVRVREAMRLLSATVPLFVAAALIEGFISFFPGSQGSKLAVGVLSEVALVLYVLRGLDVGRARSPRGEPSPSAPGTY